ncbi:peptide chain release factor N(5)-glutamine methyltransferase [Pseudocolwellia sp. AS88]|uniref:peptide chain release factor N(5)-glutamine methyltransferase n=1 Tax=Pseudocolwellia sp. AS88 TaxID=3063958 RepID=UPI0026E9682E|nr:peptide chain release factor N(5)-glutamine methyltransferase [Pseudocolwellia sp. AS88]MDO7084446.1 peptide chain release factor N(5)-glutamine methyltransferase [Pseudocolwellia sp. AS88]
MLTEKNSIKTQIEFGTALLEKVSDSAKLDSQVLLSFVLDKEINYLYTWPEKLLTEDQYISYSSLLQERLLGKPIAYITGIKEFWSLPFYCDESTLIPRPDTEVLIEIILEEVEENIESKSNSISCIDLGTGTGAIALALASEKPKWDIEAIDYNKNAVALAQRNAKHLAINNVNIYQSDWFLSVSTDKRFDVIISNPPYIDENDIHLSQGDVRFEPLTALVAEDQGLADITKIVNQAIPYLKQGGYLFFEHGYNQGEAVRNIMLASGFSKVQTIQDYGENDRVTFATFHQ